MIEYIVTVYDNGDVNWCDKDYCLHREDGPAVIYHTGSKIWYKTGIVHREGGPAIEMHNGTKEWYINGNYI